MKPKLSRTGSVAFFLALWASCYLCLVAGAASATGTVVGDTTKPESLFKDICVALQSAAKTNVVTVRPGVYVIPAIAGTENSSAWNFSGANALRNCTVDLTGVTLVFEGSNGNNLLFGDCKNATFRGATVYKKIPSFTQGKITGITTTDAENWVADVDIDSGYLWKPFLSGRFTCHIFDSKIRDAAGRPAWKANTAYFHPEASGSQEAPGKLKLTFKERMVLTKPEVGDRIVLRSKAGFSTEVRDCRDMTFQNLKLGNNGLYGIVEFGGGGTTYDNVQITYGPPPPGATEPPTVASTADGIHCLYGDPGPTFINCLIEGTPDDGIAIHGAFIRLTR